MFKRKKRNTKKGIHVQFLEKNSEQKEIAILVKCGANSSLGLEEQDYVPGLAHYLEHMMFYKSGYYIGDFFLEAGEYVNALTLYQGTVYFSTCNNDVKRIIQLLINTVFLIPNFSDENIAKEKSIILSELNKENGYSEISTQDYFKSVLYTGAASYPIIGTRDSIKEINSETLAKMYNLYYNINNIEIYFMGEFDELTTIKYIDDFLPEKIEYNNANNVIKYYFKTDVKKKVFEYKRNYKSNLLIGIVENQTEVMQVFERDITQKILLQLLPLLLKPLKIELKLEAICSDFSIDYSFLCFNPEKDMDLIYLKKEITNRIDKLDNHIIFKVLEELNFKYCILNDTFESLHLSIIEKDSLNLCLEDYNEYFKVAIPREIKNNLLLYLSNTIFIFIEDKKKYVE